MLQLDGSSVADQLVWSHIRRVAGRCQTGFENDDSIFKSVYPKRSLAQDQPPDPVAIIKSHLSTNQLDRPSHVLLQTPANPSPSFRNLAYRWRQTRNVGVLAF